MGDADPRTVERLHAVTQRLFEADNTEDVAAITVQAASELLDLELSGVWFLDEGRNHLRPVAATVANDEEFDGLPYFVENEGLVWEVFHSGESALYDDHRAVPGVYNIEKTTRSELIVPIGSHGVLIAGDPDSGQFDARDLELAELLTANAEATLRRTDRERLLRNRTEEFERYRTRFEAIAEVISSDLGETLASARRSLAGTDPDGTHVSELATAEQVLDDVEHVANAVSASRRKDCLSLDDVARQASEDVDGVHVRVIDGVTLRANDDQLRRFFSAVFRFAAARCESAPTTIHVGVLEGESGFYVEDDATPIRAGDAVFDLERPISYSRAGLAPVLAEAIATANGWSLSVSRERTDSERIEVTEVLTLSAE